MAEKILYGVIYTREDFEHFIRIKGTQTRFAQKGVEWFLLNSDYRVVGIGKSKEAMMRKYLDNKSSGWAQRLHNIQSENQGRCSYEESRKIFESLKGNKGADVRNKMGSDISEVARQLHKAKYSELGKLSFRKYQYSGTVMLIVKVPDSSPMLDEGKEGKKANNLYIKFMDEVRKTAEPLLNGYALEIETRDSYGNDL